MGIPKQILQMRQSAYKCGKFSYKINNPSFSQTKKKPTFTRDFHVYLELGMQAKHDQLLAGHCKKIGVIPRKQGDSQITHKTNSPTVTLSGFYKQKAKIAAEVTRDQMVRTWKSKGGPSQKKGTVIFKREQRIDASVQKYKQHDNNHYEISYWYDVEDIYVLFHCYPKR